MFWKLLQLSSAASLKTPSFERYKLCASSKYQYKIVACSIYCRALWRTYVLYCVLRWSSRPWPLFLSHYRIHDAYIWHIQGYHVVHSYAIKYTPCPWLTRIRFRGISLTGWLFKRLQVLHWCAFSFIWYELMPLN